jgi:L-rhamnose mutarotase
MRIALHSTLREGRELDYERAHRVVRPDLLALLQRAGISEWVIWRSGRELFHLVECDDFEAALEIIGRDPADVRWQRAMADYVETFSTNPDGAAGMGLREVWALTDQARAAANQDEEG